jgi:V8-like Glu-specific endopeptidase
MELAGEMDTRNRYMAAVKVTALSGEEEVMACSGAAISRQVVLTAGHCVCTRKQAVSPASGNAALP